VDAGSREENASKQQSNAAIDFDLAAKPCMSSASDSRTPLTATFKVRLNGETVAIDTVGKAYRFITNLSAAEWMEFRSLHRDAVSALGSAAENAMLRVQATAALRALFVRAKLL
jgi:hypothetical protein